MLPADRPSASEHFPTEPTPAGQLDGNQRLYQRLKLVLDLNLRHQVLIAVCDDVVLQNQLATQLVNDLKDPGLPFPTNADLDPPTTEPTPRLISFTPSLPNPDILAQITHWASLNPGYAAGVNWIPSFQMVGIDLLTRQSAQVQRNFLYSLQTASQRIQLLNFNLLLWVTRPWCRNIQQSVPAFWQWHTALFEFEGDPTPITEPRQSFILIPAALNGAPIAKPINQQLPPGQSLVPATVNSYADSNSGNPVTPPNPDPLQPDVPISGIGSPIGTAIGAQSSPADQEPRSATMPRIINSPYVSNDLTTLVLTAIAQESGQSQEQVWQEARELAMPALEPLRMLQRIERYYLNEAPASTFATAYYELGDWYRQRVESTQPRQADLTIVIRAYEQVLKLTEPNSAKVPDLLNNIGNLYWIMVRCPEANAEAPINLDKALKTYLFALDWLERSRPKDTDAGELGKANPSKTYAMIYNNLGALYSELAQSQGIQAHPPIDHWKRAIAAYQAALHHAPSEEDDSRYAATLNNLGTAHWNLAQHEQPMIHLKEAVAAYSRVLQYYPPSEQPLHYAMIQNNLGAAYWNLAQCDEVQQPSRPINALNPATMDNATAGNATAGNATAGNATAGNATAGKWQSAAEFLQLAIAAYRVALVYRTPKDSPALHAATQHNLGTAYWHLANQPEIADDDRQIHLFHGIDAYEAALETTQFLQAQGEPAVMLSFDVAVTHQNLGAIYHQIANDHQATIDKVERSNFLQKSLQHHINAWQGSDPEADLRQNALNAILQSIQTFHDWFGIQGQASALSSVPPSLLPMVMK